MQGCSFTLDDLGTQLHGIAKGELTLIPTATDVIYRAEHDGKSVSDEIKESLAHELLGGPTRNKNDAIHQANARFVYRLLGCPNYPDRRT